MVLFGEEESPYCSTMKHKFLAFIWLFLWNSMINWENLNVEKMVPLKEQGIPPPSPHELGDSQSQCYVFLSTNNYKTYLELRKLNPEIFGTSRNAQDKNVT
ncbi:hypothetical protein KUTeg_012559 [Tegillarca granosa]|uniref:Uncharacterized protein n=1 Tax=Tegillarca granosa TaxID=220873 RepID=A0ABQ9F038_TEGGR|nr:hypothetical protein KUTeg_012559 [Tegillarca granosa]